MDAMASLGETDLEASWTYVCDGLNTHKSESLVQFVTQQCDLVEEFGRKGKSSILKSLKSCAEFLHPKDHRIRIVYTLKHCLWRNQIEI